MRSLLLTTMCLTGSLALVACNNHRADTTDLSKQPTIEVPVASAAFTAFGNTAKEKIWRIVIEGNELSIEANFLKPTTATVIVVGSGSVNTEGVEYASTINGQPIVVNIKNNLCIDDNGYQNELTAILTYAGKAYQGCAVAGAIEIAPT
ncbi:hypothetical protein QL919_13940 [Psychrobacter sp. APC 3426]|uniref:hypothetical protein n=1 Tax=Psychrobacter sp. APC 3426 TaxID=3035177 RepID=UPI0025B335A6|nr:hypothetical protein [Psychrobacter sp. APC 3426]MDN3399828.1 hypothetical protein [Psychrobacter sp. APC 3426]